MDNLIRLRLVVTELMKLDVRLDLERHWLLAFLRDTHRTLSYDTLSDLIQQAAPEVLIQPCSKYNRDHICHKILGLGLCDVLPFVQNYRISGAIVKLDEINGLKFVPEKEEKSADDLPPKACFITKSMFPAVW